MKTRGNISFFNTLTRRKERFVPLEQGLVKMYTCGLTVYDFGHIGNFRAFVFEDLLRRWLEYRGYEVTQVMNITDVDDRTIKASRTQGVALNEITDRYIKAFFDDIDALGIEKAKYYPKATEHIPEMVDLVKKLLSRGYAYRGEDGSLYYDISKFKDYGRLAKINLEELKSGARVKVDEYAKEEARDFALWKAWDEEDGAIFWQTELGRGRPGWHIECSAMSMKYLGETFDIHCGGVDNIFPHHENEIAQSEAATGKKFVNYWLHNEHLLVNGKRMAKRLGNYYTVKDLTDKGHDPRAIRYLLLSTHYRQQFNFTFESLEAVENTLERLANFARRLLSANGTGGDENLSTLVDRFQAGFEESMDDDLNINIALAELFDFVRDVNNCLDKNMVSSQEAKQIYELVMKLDEVLGVIGEVNVQEKLTKEAEELLSKREEARQAKNWTEADRLREQLRSMGVTIEDTAQGVKWRVKKH